MYDPIVCMTITFVACSFPNLFIQLVLFRTMTFQTPNSFDGVSPSDHFVAFAYAPWFGSRYVLDDDIIMSYVCDDHLSDDISLFAMDCDDFRSHKCAVDNELEALKFGHSFARERVVHACGVYWGLFEGCVLLTAVAGFDLLFARSADEYFFCR